MRGAPSALVVRRRAALSRQLVVAVSRASRPLTDPRRGALTVAVKPASRLATARHEALPRLPTRSVHRIGQKLATRRQVRATRRLVQLTIQHRRATRLQVHPTRRRAPHTRQHHRATHQPARATRLQVHHTRRQAPPTRQQVHHIRQPAHLTLRPVPRTHPHLQQQEQE